MKHLVLMSALIFSEISQAAVPYCRVSLNRADHLIENIQLKQNPRDPSSDRTAWIGYSADKKTQFEVIALLDLSWLDLSICTSPNGCAAEKHVEPVDFVDSTGSLSMHPSVHLYHSQFDRSSTGVELDSTASIECQKQKF